jgi:hypothetical protein
MSAVGALRFALRGKAIGAPKGAILGQFIAEATVLSLRPIEALRHE